MRRWLTVAGFFFASTALSDFPLSAPRIGPAHGTQSLPSVASNGRDYLAAWIDARGSLVTPGYPYVGDSPDVYATHISSSGVPAGDGGVPVAPTLAFDGSVVVVPHGDDYVVIRSMWGLGGINGGLMMTRGDDSRLLTTPDLGGTVAGGGAHISVAWNGSVWLVIVDGFDGTATGVVIDDSFSVVKPAFPIATAAGGSASVASDGRDFVVTWIGDAVHAAVVTADGSVRTPQTVAPAAASFGTSIVWSGDHYSTAWSDGSVHTRDLGRDGAPISIDITIANSGTNPSIAWNGTTTGIAFTTAEAVAIVIVRAPLLPIVIGPGGHPSVASAGGRFLVAYEQNGDVHSKLIDGPDAVLALSLSEQRNPHGVFDGANLDFVWEEEGHVFFGRSTPQGVPLDGAGIVLGAGSAPRIAMQGTMPIIVWTNFDNAILFQRIGREAAPHALRPGSSFALACNDTDCLILEVGSGITSDVVHADGSVTHGAVIAEPRTIGYGDVAAAWTGLRYVAAYTLPSGFLRQPSQSEVVILDRDANVVVPAQPAATGFAETNRFLMPTRGGALLVRDDIVRGDITVQLIDDDGTISSPAEAVAQFTKLWDAASNGTDVFIAYWTPAGSFVARLGGTAPITLPANIPVPHLAGGAGVMALVYARGVPVVSETYPVTLSRVFWELIPPPRTIRRLWRS